MYIDVSEPGVFETSWNHERVINERVTLSRVQPEEDHKEWIEETRAIPNKEENTFQQLWR